MNKIFNQEIESSNMQSNNSKDVISLDLTLIISLRTDDFEFYKRRLELRDKCDLRGTNTIIVDDGSPSDVAEEISLFCHKRNYLYIRLETENDVFSLSRARNAGIDAATTEWVSFEDADLAYPSYHFQKLRDELTLLDGTPFNFLTVPVIYLTEGASQKIFEEGNVDNCFNDYVTNMIFEDLLSNKNNDIVESYAPATSVIALRKKKAQQIGAFDEEFEGWGGEDRDFIFRLLNENNLINKPIEFNTTKDWHLNDTVAFEGWRALYRLHGDYLAMKGIYVFHLYHERLPWRNGTKTNLERAKQKALDWKGGIWMTPQHDTNKPTDVIIGRNPFLVNSMILDSLDNPCIFEEDEKLNIRLAVKQIIELKPKIILFWNPYGTTWRKNLYDTLKKHGIPTIVGERGALPSSLYFDAGGLCIESPSYQESTWARELSEQDKAFVRAYLKQLRYGDNALEIQSDRIGKNLLRKKLNIGEGQKILFIPLQLSDDTVTVHFSEPGRGYIDYLRELNYLSLMLPDDWTLVIKTHPLAKEMVNINAATYADNFHINDLLELSNAVALFNSGTGVLAMGFNKPTYCYGPTFYRINGVNSCFDSAEQIVQELSSLPTCDASKVEQFFYYLLTEFYSFANWKGRIVSRKGKSDIFKLEELAYTDVRIPTYEQRTFKKIKIFDITKSILFDRYRFYKYYSEKIKSKPDSTTKKIQYIENREKEYNNKYKAGCTCFHNQDFKKSARYFESAAELQPENGHLRRVLAEVQIRINRREEAIINLGKARELLPGNKAIRKRLYYLRHPYLKVLMRNKPFTVPTVI